MFAAGVPATAVGRRSRDAADGPFGPTGSPDRPGWSFAVLHPRSFKRQHADLQQEIEPAGLAVVLNDLPVLDASDADVLKVDLLP